MTLRFVGNPQERIKEDALRVLRAVRFVVTKGFSLAPQTQLALSLFDLDLLAAISTERIKDEMEKCFRFSTITTMRLLDDLGLFDVLFRRMGIRLTTTMKG
jgi:tRNA nucleotidyltransferase/poly(A) polymerase